MGQWQCCTKTSLESSHRDKENMNADAAGAEDQGAYRRPLGSESAGDSGHSSGDEASCGVNGGCKVANNNGDLEGQPRNSHSSESSGKYSLRDSIGSSGDYDRPPNLPSGRIDECTMDLPVFAEENEEVFEMLPSFNSPGNLRDRRDTFQFFHDHRSRKISRGSRGSSSSDRGSFSSVSSVTAILRARLGRSSSLVSQCDQTETDTNSTCSAVVVSDGQRPQRTVSLRLPKSHRKPHDSDTNLPTIYVDDSPQQGNGKRSSRKSSLRRALSLLSMNSLMKQESTVATSPSTSQAKPQKPVQKILRQPRRRHNTVRGLSGMAIDISSQNMRNPCLHRSHTVYYPTATSLRYAGMARRTHSTAS